MKLLHELEEVKALFEIIADEMGIEPYLVEKDYWIMHALWGLQQQSFDFELKGGTSLSKGFKIINRFSEDIDIKIKPDDGENIPVGKHQDKPSHISKREAFFETLAKKINIPDMQVKRDTDFDDPKFRNAGIRLKYKSHFNMLEGIKEGVLLEVGFDTTTPNQLIDIDSWAYLKAVETVTDLTNTVAKSVKCYLPEYTFVEKLQTITRKVRQQQDTGEFGTNFLRHFYDIHQLFQQQRVKNFIGTEPYNKHKKERFRGADNPDLKSNIAFKLDEDKKVLQLYQKEFLKIGSLFISEFPDFEAIYASIVHIREIG